MGEIKFLASLALILVFTVAIVSFMTNFGEDNSAAVDLGDDPGFTGFSSELEGNTSQFVTDTNTSQEAFFRSNVESGDTTLKSGASFKVGVFSLITGMSGIGSLVYDRIFGGDPGFAFLTSFFFGILIWVGIRYIHKTWIGGNPD